MKKLWEGWKELAGYIGDFQSRFLLTVFYFTVMVPFVLIARLSGAGLADKLAGWQGRKPDDPSLEAGLRQF